MDGLEGRIVKPRNVRLVGFVLGKEKPVTTDLVVANSQQVAGPQPGAVRRQYPRWQQDAVLACERTSAHCSCGCNPLADCGVIQGDWARPWGLDPSEGANYTLVHVALICCEVHQRSQHASVVGYGGGCQVVKSGVQVGVNPVGGQVAGLPRKPPAQYDELLKVSGASPNAAPVCASEVGDAQVAHSQRVGDYPPIQVTGTPPQIRYNPPMGQLAQLYSWIVWLGLRRWSILRGAYLTLLCVCLYLHRVESALGLLALGQLAEAIREFRKR